MRVYPLIPLFTIYTKVYLGICGGFLIGEEIGAIGSYFSKTGHFTNRITDQKFEMPKNQTSTPTPVWRPIPSFTIYTKVHWGISRYGGVGVEVGAIGAYLSKLGHFTNKMSDQKN